MCPEGGGSGPVRFEREGSGLAVLTFAGPPLNLFDREMMDAVGAAVAAAADDPPRALLIKAFVSEVVEALGNDAVAESLDARSYDWLAS